MENELIALDITSEFNTHVYGSGSSNPNNYWTNSITITLESEAGEVYSCQYQDNEFARIIVPFSGTFRVHVRGNLVAHFPNEGCMDADQEWRILKIN